MVNRLLNSPTLMTWLSYSTKALALFGILPLVLRQFPEQDVVLWYLFSTIIATQGLADFGFRQTFSRIISYAYKGVKEIVVGNGKFELDPALAEKPNYELLSKIVSTMKHIYIPLTIIMFLLMLTGGTWFMYKPINHSTDISGSWIAWAIVVLVSTFSFYGKLYMNFLEGLFKIALVRRVETVTSLGAILSSIAVLIYAPTLLNLVLTNQFWLFIATIRDIYLCKKTEDGIYNRINTKAAFDRAIFDKIWPPAWRSGISGLMSVGLTNLTGMIYAQIGDTSSVASYLLALRIITQIRDISMAPFYSKIPLLAMLRAKSDILQLLKVVKRGMFLSHMVFILGVLFIGFFSNYFLSLIHSDTKFVEPRLWALLSFAFFAHRFGAMHIQVYLSTNHVISHIADGISGIIYILVSLLLINIAGIYAIPLGMLVGYFGFYSWYAAKYSYRSLNTRFWDFEKNTSLIPVLLAISYTLFTLIYP